jgi:hypothetical protein
VLDSASGDDEGFTANHTHENYGTDRQIYGLVYGGLTTPPDNYWVAPNTPCAISPKNGTCSFPNKFVYTNLDSIHYFSNDLTIAMSIQPHTDMGDFSEIHTIYHHGGLAISNNQGLAFSISSVPATAWRLYAIYFNGAWRDQYVDVPLSVITPGQRHHVAIQYSRTGGLNSLGYAVWWIDGVAVATIDFTYARVTTNQGAFFGERANTSTTSAGDDSRFDFQNSCIWNRLLSQAEIEELAELSLVEIGTPTQDPLGDLDATYNWLIELRLNEAAGSLAYDSASGATWTVVSPASLGTATTGLTHFPYAYNGSTDGHIAIPTPSSLWTELINDTTGTILAVIKVPSTFDGGFIFDVGRTDNNSYHAGMSIQADKTVFMTYNNYTANIYRVATDNPVPADQWILVVGQQPGLTHLEGGGFKFYVATSSAGGSFWSSTNIQLDDVGLVDNWFPNIGGGGVTTARWGSFTNDSVAAHRFEGQIAWAAYTTSVLTEADLNAIAAVVLA